MTKKIQSRTFFLAFMLACSVSQNCSFAYDPLETLAESEPQVQDYTVHDAKRDRDIPIRVYFTRDGQSQPVVLFSHGLGGSREGSSYLGQHWARRGYLAVFLQHPGSDESVWKGTAVRNRMAAMNDAASGKNFALRVADIPAVLDQLASWNLSKDHPLHQSMDLKKVGMSGHSFGAVTTQAVSGQAYGLLGQRYTDERIRAAIAMSPSVPRLGNPKTAFGKVSIPWLLMTGTNDKSPIGNQTVESRLDVFPNLGGAADRYQLVLNDAEHSAFSDRGLPGEKNGRNPNHHKAILAISTAFWDTYLKQDLEARNWLRSDARSVLEDQDRWEIKVKE